MSKRSKCKVGDEKIMELRHLGLKWHMWVGPMNNLNLNEGYRWSHVNGFFNNQHLLLLINEKKNYEIVL